MIHDIIEFLQKPQFRVPDEAFFRTLWPTILGIIRNPASNPAAAVVLVAIAVVILVMVGLAITYFLISLGEEEEEEFVYVLAETGESVAAEALAGDAASVAGADAPAAGVVKARWVKDPLRFHRSFLWWFAILTLLLIATGITTQSRAVCISCHDNTSHVARTTEEGADEDPHGDVACVRCHEGGNPVASVSISVAPRLIHMAEAVRGIDNPGGFGAANSRACERCHSDIITRVTENEFRALRMSHVEPVDAGAVCLDCHGLDSHGAVSGAIGGMDSCLRCHDGSTAASECSTCHTGDVSRAVVVRSNKLGIEPRQLIAKPDCYSCHDPAGCDACHGVRLPHPEEYQVRHMRDAAIDLWDNQGKTCFSCHTENRRSCYRSGPCHELEMPMHSVDGSFRYEHRRASPGECDDCHNRLQMFPNTCAMCHPQ
jgi:hypothetical protein